MSRFVGDALVAGAPEDEREPEVVTVKMTRGQAEVLASAADELASILGGDGFLSECLSVRSALKAFRAQIGGAR